MKSTIMNAFEHYDNAKKTIDKSIKDFPKDMKKKYQDLCVSVRVYGSNRIIVEYQTKSPIQKSTAQIDVLVADGKVQLFRSSVATINMINDFVKYTEGRIFATIETEDV